MLFDGWAGEQPWYPYHVYVGAVGIPRLQQYRAIYKIALHY